MKLYLVNAENIYFPQIKEYFREIISSYDNGNYRSAMVMLYSTIVCDLLLKLKELTDVYSDEKAERILEETNQQRKKANNSSWEWELIEKVWKQTELLSDEAYAILQHIYSLRNFSAHPAMTDEYELIAPTAEITVAYIKKALDLFFTKPSVFAQNIVDRMSDDISAKKELYRRDFDGFRKYLNRVYFERMPDKMMNQVFKAFWKFAFIKVEGEIFEKNRVMNRMALTAMVDDRGEAITQFIQSNKAYFTIAQDSACLLHATILLAKRPQIYVHLDEAVKHQLDVYDEKGVFLIKWFAVGDLSKHIEKLKNSTIKFEEGPLRMLKSICEEQGQAALFRKMIIAHYANSSSFSCAKNRFDKYVCQYMDEFDAEDFVELIEAINGNPQIYNYGWQDERNNLIVAAAQSVLPADFDFSKYEHFEYTKKEPIQGQDDAMNAEVEDDDPPF